MKMDRSILLIIIAMLIGVVGQVCLKAGMNQVGKIEAVGVTQLLPILLSAFSKPLVWIGLAAYAASAMFWLIVLARFDLSYAYPMLASMYLVIPVVSLVFLKESIPPLRWLGMVVVLIGVVLVSRG
jgi:multidrug transporter EmrE-like cation transporter